MCKSYFNIGKNSIKFFWVFIKSYLDLETSFHCLADFLNVISYIGTKMLSTKQCAKNVQKHEYMQNFQEQYPVKSTIKFHYLKLCFQQPKLFNHKGKFAGEVCHSIQKLWCKICIFFLICVTTHGTDKKHWSQALEEIENVTYQYINDSNIEIYAVRGQSETFT